MNSDLLAKAISNTERQSEIKRDFDSRVQSYLNEKRENQNKLYAETVENRDNYKNARKLYSAPQQYYAQNDDAHHTKTWNECLRACAFYYDNPTVEDKKRTLEKLQLKFDPIFADGWTPPLNNRRSLLTWACEQRNQAFENSGNEDGKTVCHYHNLLKEYGPDYETVKQKLGFVRGVTD